jgi:large subunit ribosomal protein L4
MPQVQLRDLKNREVRALDLPGEVFDYPARPHLVYEAVCHHRARQRAGTHATKNRVDVSGGGRKPWRQKKTGRARVGSIRSPLWRGGGTVHGPEPRDYDYAFPRRMQRNALRSVLSEKVRDGKLVVVSDLALASHRTRDFVATLEGLGLTASKTLFVDTEIGRELGLAAGNLGRVRTQRAMQLNAYDVLNHEVLVLSLPALERLAEWLTP